MTLMLFRFTSRNKFCMTFLGFRNFFSRSDVSAPWMMPIPFKRALTGTKAARVSTIIPPKRILFRTARTELSFRAAASILQESSFLRSNDAHNLHRLLQAFCEAFSRSAPSNCTRRNNIFFARVLDGQTVFRNMRMFLYLVSWVFLHSKMKGHRNLPRDSLPNTSKSTRATGDHPAMRHPRAMLPAFLLR